MNYLIHNYQIPVFLNQAPLNSFFKILYFFFPSKISFFFPFTYQNSGVPLSRNLILFISQFSNFFSPEFFFPKLFLSNFFYISFFSYLFLERFDRMILFFFLGLLNGRDLIFLNLQFSFTNWFVFHIPFADETNILKLK